MENTKLIAILRVLNAKKLGQLKKLMQSPLFYRRKEAIALFNYLVPYAPHYNNAQLLRSTVAQALFPKQPESTMNRAISELFQLIEDYIAFQAADDNSINKQLSLLEFYADHQLDKLFNHTLLRIQELMSQEAIRNERYYYYQYSLNEIVSAYTNKQQSKQTDQYIALLGQNLDTFYVITKLQYLCTVFNRASINNVQHNISLLDELIQYIKSNALIYNIPAVQLYYHALLMQYEKKDEHFFILKSLLGNYYTLLHKNQQLGLYQLLKNYCIFAIKEGKSDFRQYLLELYQSNIATKLLHNNDDYITHATFKNIITLYVQCEQFQNAHTFIAEHQTQLSPQYRQYVLDYCLGFIAYHEHKFEIAIAHLQNVNVYPNIYYQLDTRKLLILLYYEQAYYAQQRKEELLDNAITSLHKFVKEQKTMVAHEKKLWRAFCRGMTKLLQIAISQQSKQAHKPKLDNINEDIQQMSPKDQIWFNDQLNRLGLR